MAVAKRVLIPIGILLDAVHPERRAKMSFRSRVCVELSEGVDGQLSPGLRSDILSGTARWAAKEL